MSQSTSSELVPFSKSDKGPEIIEIPVIGEDGTFKRFIGIRIDDAVVTKGDEWLNDVCRRLIYFAAHLKQKYGRIYDPEYL